jgi:hypothetical protein
MFTACYEQIFDARCAHLSIYANPDGFTIRAIARTRPLVHYAQTIRSERNGQQHDDPGNPIRNSPTKVSANFDRI